MLTAAAFVAGAIVGAFAVGSPFSPTGPKAVVMVHVENSGSGDLDARIDVRDAGGGFVVGTTFKVPAHSSVDKTVVNLNSGVYEVRGSFSQGQAQATGSARVDTRACPDGTVGLATFTLDGSNGAAMTAPPASGCRN